MLTPSPVTLERDGVRLTPLTAAHANGLADAAADGELWDLWYTSVPRREEVTTYIDAALQGQEAGTMLPWIVEDVATGLILGSTRFHDIIVTAGRVEIGYTWYRASRHRTHVNTICKLLIFSHSFDTLACGVVGLRTDNFNFRSQRAIEALGAKKDGAIRHHMARRDGTIRDSVMYSVLATEWPDVRRHLEARLLRHRDGGPA